MRLILTFLGLILTMGISPAQIGLPTRTGFHAQGRGWSISLYSGYPANWGMAHPWIGWGQQVVILYPPTVSGFRVPPRSDRLIRPAFPTQDPKIEQAQARARLDEAVHRGDLLVIQPQPPQLLPQWDVASPVVVPKVVVLDDDTPPEDLKQRAIFEVNRAKAAFRLEQFGLAGERLESACRNAPDDAMPWFLLAQVQTAQGHYREAVQSLQKGLHLAPDWPTTAFKLGEIYDGNEQAFPQHLTKLKAAHAIRPADPMLTFLLAYHYWFLGDRAAATKLFQQVSATVHVRDKAIVELFLNQTDS